jgi:hypothetical protein
MTVPIIPYAQFVSAEAYCLERITIDGSSPILCG